MAKEVHLHLDLPGNDLKKFKIGQKVKATVTGIITELEAAREMDFGGDEKEKYPPRMELKLSSKAKVTPVNSALDDLASD